MKALHASLDIFRAFFWFQKGELQEIATKISMEKPGYDTRPEAFILLILGAGIWLAFLQATWFGFVYLYAFKVAIQSLNEKRFFDPRQ